MEERKITKQPVKKSGPAKTEDAVLKTMMQFFADELLPLFGINGKVEEIVPTELVEIKNPMTEFTEGVNTYRVVPIIMQEKNADEFIKSLQDKKIKGERLTKSDMVWLTLGPLMGGTMSQKERIRAAFQLTKEKTELSTEEQKRIGAVIYAMANKFLDSMDMEAIKEEVKMTKLGEMLVEDGRVEGRAEGRAELVA